MNEVEEYIKQIDTLNNQLAMTRNDLAIANQRAKMWQKKYEEVSAENEQLKKGILPNYKPSFEEVLALAMELNLIPGKEEHSQVQELPQGDTDTTPSDSEGYPDSSTEREKELELKLEEKERELEEKERKFAEILRQTESEKEELNKKNGQLEQDLDNSKSTVKNQSNDRFGQKTESQKYQTFLGGPQEDRRIEEGCFNGQYVDRLNQEEKDRFMADYKEFLANQAKKQGKKSEDIEKEIKNLLKKEGYNVTGLREVRSRKKRDKLADIDYNKSEEEIKEQLRKALCPNDDPENVEVLFISGDIPGRVINRKGKPDFSYYVAKDMVQQAKFKTVIIQGVRIEAYEEEKQECAPQEEVLPMEESAIVDEDSTPEDPEEDEGLKEEKQKRVPYEGTPHKEESSAVDENEATEYSEEDADPEEENDKKKKSCLMTYWADRNFKRALNCCCFTTILLTWILTEKYKHGSTYDDIIDRLRQAGCHMVKSTFNENVHRVCKRLRLSCNELILKQIRLAHCLQADETFVIVAVKEKDIGPDGNVVEVTRFRIRYIWCFLDDDNHIVSYVYEDGSRSSDVLKCTLFPEGMNRSELRLKALISDGYSAYNLFEKLNDDDNPFIGEDGKPMVLHCGDWVHARRRVCRSIFESPEEAFALISLIRELFVIEAVAKHANLTPDRKESLRMNHSLPVMNEIFKKVEEYSKDPVLMARKYTKEAITYLINQKTRLMNYVQDGYCPVSTNRVESMMKPVKKILRVSMFIGSEEAARDFAFMLSLSQTVKEMGISFPDYMQHLLEGLQDVPRLREGKEKKFQAVAMPMAEPLMPWEYIKSC